MYEVYLDDVFIYGVEEIEYEFGRTIEEYQGLGQGRFSIPEDPDLRTFGIACELTEFNQYGKANWIDAKVLFAHFEKAIQRKEPMRLISVSAFKKSSSLVYVKSYNKTETYAGVYRVQINLVEHKPVAIRTEGVPYIKREGKIPAESAEVVLGGKKTVYSTQKNLNGESPKIEDLILGRAYDRTVKRLQNAAAISEKKTVIEIQKKNRENARALQKAILNDYYVALTASAQSRAMKQYETRGRALPRKNR